MSAFHHVAVTVSDLKRSITFYEKMGFKVLTQKDTPEKQKRSAFLAKDDLNLEMFYYQDFTDNPSTRNSMGNNVKEVGQKHFAIRVDSIDQTRQDLEAKGIVLESETDIGDAGYKFFFIRDPDGIWIEYVEDDRY